MNEVKYDDLTMLEERSSETRVRLHDLLWCKPVNTSVIDCEGKYHQQKIAEMHKVAKQLAKGLKPQVKRKKNGKVKKDKKKDIGFFKQILRVFKIIVVGALVLFIALLSVMIYGIVMSLSNP